MSFEAKLCVGSARGALGWHVARAARRAKFFSVKIHWRGAHGARGALGWRAARRAETQIFSIASRFLYWFRQFCSE